MTYATQRDKFSRTRQDLLVIGVRECQNHYASKVQQLLTRTEELDHADWSKTGVTITADAAEAPDGTMTADSFTFDDSADAIFQIASGEVPANKAYTASVWLRATVASNFRVVLTLDDDTFSDGQSLVPDLTTEWVRYWFHYLFDGTATGDIRFGIERQIAGHNGTFEVWGAQLYRNPSDVDRVVKFPYRRRVAEAASTTSVCASRCEAPDQGDGARCFYSRPTCQDSDNFNAGNIWEETPSLRGIREYRFCRKDSPIPFNGEEVTPSLVRMPTAAQEIDAERAVTVNERITFEFEDEAMDVAWNKRQTLDGGLVNSGTGGTFWGRFRVIYRNYSNPECYVDRKTGFLELTGAIETPRETEDLFQSRGKFLMLNIETVNRRVKLICGSRLKLARVDIPGKISDDNLVTAALTSGATTISVSDASEITEPASNAADASPDYVVTLELDPEGTSEKVNVLSRDVDANTVTVQRGRWGTAAAAHAKNIAFREIYEFGTERSPASGVPVGKSPINCLIEMYLYAGLSRDEIDIAALEAERDTWLPYSLDVVTGDQDGVLFRRTLIETKKVEDLAKEVRELSICFLWVNDSQMVTGRLYAPRRPTEAVRDLTDDANLIVNSIEVDDNDESRISRALVAWELPEDGSPDTAEDFNQVRIELDIDSEEREFYGDRRLRVLLTEWLQQGADDPNAAFNAAYWTGHLLSRFRHGSRIIRAKLEIKDDDVQVGDYVRVTTDHIQDSFGNQLPTEFHVTKKKRDGDRIQIEGLDTGPFARTWFYAADATPDYDSASDEEKRYGFLSDDKGMVGTPKVPAHIAW